MSAAGALARHRAYVPHYGNGWVACSCGEGEDDNGFDYNAHLASIVSRRDADLGTRIEELRVWYRERYEAAPFSIVGDQARKVADDLDRILAETQVRALNTDTHEETR